MKFDWWTLGLQTINVLVLLWILRRFFFKPVAAMIARRQDEIRQQSDEAGQAKQQAEQERQALLAERSAIAAERQQVLEQARVEAQTGAAAVLKQAQDDAAARSAASKATLAKERAEAADAVLRAAGELAADIASRLLQRIPAGRLDECFVEEAYAAIPAPSRHDSPSRNAAHGQITIEIVGSTPFGAAAQEHVKQILCAKLGYTPILEFSADPALLAGVELRIDQTVVANNLAADLRHILEQTQRERASA